MIISKSKKEITVQNKLNSHVNCQSNPLIQIFQIKEPESVLSDQLQRNNQLPAAISLNHRASWRQMKAGLEFPSSQKCANLLMEEIDYIELERQADEAALIPRSNFKKSWSWEFHLTRIDNKYRKAAEAAAKRGDIDRAVSIYEKRLRLFENEWDVNIRRREILEEAIAKFEKEGPAEILPPLYMKLLEFLDTCHLSPDKPTLDRWDRQYLIPRWIQKADLYEKLGIEKEKRLELYRRAADELVKSEKFYLDDEISFPSRLAAAILYEKIQADPALIEKTYRHFFEESSPYLKELLEIEEEAVFSLYGMLYIILTKPFQFAAYKLNQKDDWLAFLDKEFCLLGHFLQVMLTEEESRSGSVSDKFLDTIAYFFSLGDLLYRELNITDPEKSNMIRKKAEDIKTLLIEKGHENVLPTIEIYLQDAIKRLDEFFNGSLENQPFDKIADLFSYNKIL